MFRRTNRVLTTSIATLVLSAGALATVGCDKSDTTDTVETVDAVAPATLAFALPAAAGKVMFIGIKDGDTLTGEKVDGKIQVALKFGARGITIAPAGKASATEGHHHVLVDTADVKAGVIIGADAQHIHYGKAQTSTTLGLAPGSHTLTLQLADGLHRSYGAAWRSKVKVTVKAK